MKNQFLSGTNFFPKKLNLLFFMKTCTRSSPITETLGLQGKIEAMRYIFDAVTGGYLYHSWKMNTSVAIGQGWRISVYTLNNPIHSNKYCSFRQQSLRLLAMLRLRDLFCFSMFSIHCLMTAKFSPAKPALAWSWSSPNAISKVQCSRFSTDQCARVAFSAEVASNARLLI